MHPFSAGNYLAAGVAGPPQPYERGCKDHPEPTDIYGVPLDNLVPETVYPAFSNARAPGDTGGLRSGSQAYLVALPLSTKVIQRLAGWADLDQLGVRGIAPSELESQTPPEIRHVVFGPYEHFGWSGHVIVTGSRYKLPDGKAFAFTCDPGQKWGSCAVSYTLKPGLGLAYMIWGSAAPPAPASAQALEQLVVKMIASDRQIRAYALGLIVNAH